MRFTLFTADYAGNAKNCLYPHRNDIISADELAKAAMFDHVCAEYDKSYRANENFMVSDCIVMDCDNDHTEDASEWIRPESFCEYMPDVCFAVVPSRNNMKQKGEKSARPRMHLYFPISHIESSEEYTKLKRAIYTLFPFFDENALDASRFIFGCDVMQEDCIWNEGSICIDEYVEMSSRDEAIKEGSRNNTLSRFAGRILKRYGICDKALNIFMRKAEKCEPPLDEQELNSIWVSACKFAEKIQKQPGYIPPEEYEQARTSLEPEDYSDIGQSRAFLREFGDEMLYTTATDFMRYNGTCWVESKQQAVGAMEEFLDLQLEDAIDRVTAAKEALMSAGVEEKTILGGGKTLEKSVDEDDIKLLSEYTAALTYRAFVQKRRDMKYILSALLASKPPLEMSVDRIDANEFMLNTPAGTYDLSKGMDGRKEHDAKDYISKITAVSPSDEGRELWEDALNTIFCGDEELIRYVQMICGLAAIGKVYVEALIIAYGDGHNGKSTFWNTIANVLGTYSGSISADALTVGCRRNVKPELAEVKGKRFIIAAELEEGMRLNTSVIKQLCSTDRIFAEKKYKDPFSFTPTHTLVLYTNHLPKVGANDSGTWRRLIVIPFNAKIEGSADKKNYASFLTENAGEYILKWIIEGAKNIIDRGFRIPVPSCVSDAITAYREENDWLSHFLDECCEIDKSFSQKSGDLYQEYRAYCTRTGEYIRSTADFYTALQSNGFEKRKLNCGRYIFGLRLKSEFLAE